jgi:predicted MFS family arabinose efflux permease
MAHRFGGLLWQRNFRLLWTGETVSQIGNSMAAIGVSLLAVTMLRASTFTVSALAAAQYLPWLIIGLPAGAWADRLSSRPLMVVCDIISALLYGSLPVAAWIGMLTTGQVLAVALLAGAANVLFATAYQLCLPELVAADELMEGNAKLQGSSSAASIGGGSVAGLAAKSVGDATALLFNVGSFLVSAACLLCIRTGAPSHEAPKRTNAIRAEIFEGAWFIVRDPFLRPLAIFTAVANLAYAGSTALVIVFLVRVAGFGPAAVGLLVASEGVGGVAGAMAARRVARRLGTARTLLLAALGTGLFGLLIPLTGQGPRVLFYIVGSAVVGAGITGGGVIIVSFRQAYCPRTVLGRVITSQRVLVFGTMPLGALLAGGLGTALGVRNALWVILAIYVLSGALLLTPAISADKNLPSGSATFPKAIASAHFSRSVS